MPNFLEERIPVGARLGASWADMYNVQISRTSSGNEYRRLVHPFPARQFSIAFTTESGNLWTLVMDLYHRVYGRFAGFRAKCLDDFSTNAQTLPPTAQDEPLVQLTSTTFRLVKRYGGGNAALNIGKPVRTLFKPVAGTVKIAVAGVVQNSGWSVDTTTGIVTFTVAPVGVVTGGCEFDLPVRFDTDLLVHQIDPNVRELQTIALVEILNP